MQRREALRNPPSASPPYPAPRLLEPLIAPVVVSDMDLPAPHVVDNAVVDLGMIPPDADALGLPLPDGWT